MADTKAVTLYSGQIAQVQSGDRLVAPAALASSSGVFESTTSSAYLATTGAGTIYLRPNGSASATGQVTLSSAGVLTAPTVASTIKVGTGQSVFSSNSTGRNVTHACDYYVTGTTTGAIVFIAPTVTAVMVQADIGGREYNPHKAYRVIVNGYKGASGTAWTFTSAVQLGRDALQVRLGTTPSGLPCIILGDVATAWSYVHMSLLNLMLSHSGGNDANAVGWTTALETDLSLYTLIMTPTAAGIASDITGDAAGVTGGAAGTLVYQSGVSTTAFLAAGTTAQILVGGGAAAPVWTTATGTGAPVRAISPTFTGTITAAAITASGAIAAASMSLTAALPIASGGTNSTATPTAGGIGYGTGTAHAYSAAGIAGQYLKSGVAGAPTWNSLSMLDIPDSSWKKAVTIATTANITLSGEQTIDGVLTSATRILVKNQSTPAQNGIYTTAVGAWSRTPDADLATEISSALVSVDAGTVNGGQTFSTAFKSTDTLGTTAMNWYRVYTSQDTILTAPTGTGFIRVTGGVVDAASIAETGTGNVVRSASPTLTGTVSAAIVNASTNFGAPIFSSSTTSVIIAATGSGTVYLRPNGSGTTSGQAYLDTSGNLFVTGGSIVSSLGSIYDASGNVRYMVLGVSNANKTFAASEANQAWGKNNTTGYTYTIPANSSVAYPDGTMLTFYNNGASGNITIAITTDTMYLAGTATTGSRTLAARGMATALKVAATTWLISGTGLT